MTGRTISHYEITEKLGEGGMGVVYKSRDTHLDRFVAIKVLPAERVADADRKARFVQEAKAASALNHPNIVHIYDIDQQDGVGCIAMEYVEGKTLGQLIGRKGLKLSEALKYGVQIADALGRAHAGGIIHRDLKPGNIMVDEHGLVKVLDCGPHREPAGSARPRPVPDTHHQAGYGYVLIQLFPMQAGSPSADDKLGALFRTCAQQTREVRKRHTQLAAVCQFDPQRILIQRDPPGAGFNRQSAHSKTSESDRGSQPRFAVVRVTPQRTCRTNWQLPGSAQARTSLRLHLCGRVCATAPAVPPRWSRRKTDSLCVGRLPAHVNQAAGRPAVIQHSELRKAGG